MLGTLLSTEASLILRLQIRTNVAIKGEGFVTHFMTCLLARLMKGRMVGC
jgi:hypothetical protein